MPNLSQIERDHIGTYTVDRDPADEKRDLQHNPHVLAIVENIAGITVQARQGMSGEKGSLPHQPTASLPNSQNAPQEQAERDRKTTAERDAVVREKLRSARAREKKRHKFGLY